MMMVWVDDDDERKSEVFGGGLWLPFLENTTSETPIKRIRQELLVDDR